MLARLALTVGVLALSACTTATQINGPQGEELVLINCGAAVSIGICHERAKQECPNGYVTVSERGGFNRKEIRVQCK